MTLTGDAMRILLIDDEPFALKLLIHQLRGLGHGDVIGLARARDALDLLQAGEPRIDMILCDLQMPEMDGVEFVRHLAGIGFVGGLVLISGEDERILHTAGRLARAHRLNVLGALRKPVDPARLRAVLEARRATTPTLVEPEPFDFGPEDLWRAITGGRVINHYQPKVALDGGEVIGVEALARWRQPDGELIGPDRFVPVAEQHGLIDALTRVVLVNALRQVRTRREAGLDLHVAVNVSMANLDDLDFPDFIAREATRADVPLTSLVLEVTESRLMVDPLAPLDILSRLRLKHIELSIDDFGTGYSSLAQLRDLPFVELKVDRGFVHCACREPDLCAIFEASLGMARQLGLRTVAEGVENADDWRFLRDSGCDLAQGYFIARPMPAMAVAGWATEWRERYPVLLAGRT